MEEIIFIGQEQQMHKVSQTMWKQHLAQIPEHGPARLRFMTDAHRLVRNFVVKELAVRQQPIEPELLSDVLSLPLDQVKKLLDELEQKLFFLVQNEHGAVTWAYPITIESTPHRLCFNGRERLYAA
jgi:hypothetical protein